MIFLPALQPLMPAAAFFHYLFLHLGIYARSLGARMPGRRISEVPRSLLLLLRPK